MTKVSLDEVFFDFFDVMKVHVSESDHVVICMELIRSLEDFGYDLNILRGHDDIVDEAMDELYPDASEDYDDDEGENDENY